MRNLVVAGNWKMNKTNQEGVSFVNELKSEDLSKFDCKKMVFVPSVMLETLVKEAAGSEIIIGAENMHEEESGAYTGEVSADMLKAIGVNDTLIGHSERRQYFNETDEVVNKKMKLALAKDINPVLCIGETLEERESNMTNSVLDTQIKGAFAGIEASDLKNVIIAYEPVWAIGTGLTATPEQANEACAYVRSVVESIYSAEVANEMIIQYGGSVNPKNVDDILSQSDIDGALVGGASLEVESYVALLK